MAETMRPEDVPDELVQAAVAALMTAADLNDTLSVIRVTFAAALPVHAQRVRTAVADDIERHAESIGWYEGGGVWAEAIGVARHGYRDDDD